MIKPRIRVMPAVMALFGLPFLWEDAQALPVGAATTASYDPAQPGNCFLRPGISTGPIVFLAIGIVLPLLAFLSQAVNDARALRIA